MARFFGAAELQAPRPVTVEQSEGADSRVLLSRTGALAHNSAMSDSKLSLRQSLESITITRRRTRFQIIHNRAALALTAAAILVIYFIVILITFHPSGITARQDNLSLLIRGSWGVVGFAAAIGVASAGVIQIVKQLAGVRGYFQRIWVMEWIGDRVSNKTLWNRWVIDNRDHITETTDTPTTATFNENLAKQIVDVQRERAASELEEALLGGLSQREFRRVFDLPTEQLCAQISIAADLAMSRPNDFAELLLALTGPSGLKQIDALAQPSLVLADGHIIREPDEDNLEPVYDNMAYPLVSQGVRTGVDLLQISLGQRWRRGIQWSAVIVSGGLGVVAAFLLREPVTTQVLLGVAALVLGGFFAWLVRDLVAIVERARR
jgi:hypothetical protein